MWHKTTNEESIALDMKGKMRLLPKVAAIAVCCLALMVTISNLMFEHKEKTSTLNTMLAGTFPQNGFHLQYKASGVETNCLNLRSSVLQTLTAISTV